MSRVKAKHNLNFSKMGLFQFLEVNFYFEYANVFMSSKLADFFLDGHYIVIHNIMQKLGLINIIKFSVGVLSYHWGLSSGPET